MAEHTAGPWKFRTVTEHDHGGRAIALLLETQHRPMPHNDPCVLAVRDDWLHYLMHTPRGRANRALIEAAPELLEALQGLLDWGREHTSPRDENSPHALLVAACEAIAKATTI